MLFKKWSEVGLTGSSRHDLGRAVILTRPHWSPVGISGNIQMHSSLIIILNPLSLKANPHTVRLVLKILGLMIIANSASCLKKILN